MRRHYIVSGIFIILSIVDFVLAAPVLVQEKRQASADVVHKPKDLVTVLWERGDDEEYWEVLEWIRKESDELKEEYYKLPDAYASSSAAPPGPDHGSTNILQPPTLNPASSTADPYPVLEPSRPWSPVRGDGESQPDPNPNKRLLTGPDSPDPNFDWDFWTNLDSDGPPPKRPALSKEPGQAHDDQAEFVSGSFGSSTESNFDRTKYDEVNRKIDRIIAKLNDLDQAHQHQMGHLEQMNPGPSADADFDRNYRMNVEDPSPLRPASSKPSNPGPSNPSLPTEPPSTAESAHPELYPDDQEMDRQAAIYTAKGKEKQLRRVSGTARDVATAQRELQPGLKVA